MNPENPIPNPTVLGIPVPAPQQFLDRVDRLGDRLGLNVPPIFTLDQLQAMPPESLGWALANHFAEHAIHPLTTGPRRKQLHDAVHVLTGYGTDPIGELEVQAFMLGSKFFPTHLVIGLGLWAMADRGGFTRADWRSRMQRAYQRGRKTRFDIDHWQPEQQWHLPLAQIQRHYGV
jgi:ubiquinone biosynthesis protein COQ4